MNELIFEDTLVGTGAEVKQKDKIAIHYTGMLADGKVFDSSYERDEPLVVRVGVGQLIRGWDVGIIGLKEGGKRTLRIPYMLAYGEEGFPPTIPPQSDLIFDVELIEIM
jgi:FKBP-type peptidyl-prolyl cis-trans isomerase